MEIQGKINLNKNQYGKYIPVSKPVDVFFGKKKKKKKINSLDEEYEEIVGLNGLDSSILDKNFETNVKKKPLKIELKLEKAENKLEKLEQEMKTNELLGLNTAQENERLEKTRQRLRQDVQKHREEYRSLGFSYQISDTINLVNREVKKQISELKEVIAGFLPSAQERKQVQYAKMLDKKLSNEMHRPGKIRTEQVEPLLFHAEKINKKKIT